VFFSHRRILSLPAPTGSLAFSDSRKGTPTYFLFPHFLIIALGQRYFVSLWQTSWPKTVYAVSNFDEKIKGFVANLPN
jgi:hypothetical protein